MRMWEGTLPEDREEINLRREQNMMVIFTKQVRKVINTLPVMIFAKQMSQMINTLLMMMEAGRREKGYIAEVLTCD